MPGESGSTLIAADAGSPYAIAVPTAEGDHIYTAAAVIEGEEQPMSAPATVTIPAP